MIKNSLWAAATGSSQFSYRSLESYDVNEEIVNPVTNEVVGEADSEIAELAVESLSISQEMDEIQRTANVAEAGEVIADVATKVAGRDSTPEEAALVQAGAAQTAIAAGATASDVAEVADQVASESNGKFRISNEGFVDTIKNLWRKLKEWVMGLIQKIKNAWNRFWNSTESLKKKAKKLLKLLEEKSDKKKEDKLEKWSGYFRNITVGGKFDPKESLKVYQELYKTGTDLGKDIIDMIEDLNKDVSDLAKKTPSDIDGMVEKIMKEITGGSNGNVSDYLGNGYLGIKIPFPFGNKAAVKGFDGNRNISTTAKINSFTVKIVDDQKTFDPKPKDIKLDYLGKNEIETLAKSTDDLAKALEDWYNKGSKDADKKIADLRKKIDDEIDKVNEGDDAVMKDKVRILQRFFTVPAQALRYSMEGCTYFIRTANDMLSFGFLCAKNLENDKKDK